MKIAWAIVVSMLSILMCLLEASPALTENTKPGLIGFSYDTYGDKQKGILKRAVISRVFSNTPAEQAGLQAKDSIKSINKQPVNGMLQQDFERLLKGPPGSVISFVVTRNEVDKVVSLTRAEGDFSQVQQKQAAFDKLPSQPYSQRVNRDDPDYSQKWVNMKMDYEDLTGGPPEVGMVAFVATDTVGKIQGSGQPIQLKKGRQVQIYQEDDDWYMVFVRPENMKSKLELPALPPGEHLPLCFVPKVLVRFDPLKVISDEEKQMMIEYEHDLRVQHYNNR